MKFFIKKSLVLITFFCSFNLQIAFAQTTGIVPGGDFFGSSTESAETLTAVIKNLSGGYGGFHTKQQDADKDNLSLFYPSPSAKPNYFVNAVLKDFFAALQINATPLAENPESKGQTDSKAAHGPAKTLTAKAIDELTQMTNALAAQRVGDSIQKIPSPMNSKLLIQATGTSLTAFDQSTYQSKQPSPTASFNLDSLVVPLQYSGKTEDGSNITKAEAARNFISFVSGLAKPSPIIAFSEINKDDLQDMLGKPEVDLYIAAVLNQASYYAVGLSNLYMMYAQRQPTSVTTALRNAGLNANQLPNFMQQEASPLAIDSYMAQRRVQDAKWYQEMETATPATIERETLYTLAEIRYELYQQRLIQERVLATLSVMEMQNSTQNQFNIDNLRRSVCSQDYFKNYSGLCPKDASIVNIK